MAYYGPGVGMGITAPPNMTPPPPLQVVSGPRKTVRLASAEVCEQRYRDHCRRIHAAKLANMRHAIDTTAPKTFPHLQHKVCDGTITLPFNTNVMIALM
jgi:hypothetical protein